MNVKRLLVALVVLGLLVPLWAQKRTGNIYGRVTDETGTPLPGVAVTISGEFIAPLTMITGSEGRFRFLSLPPGKYDLKFELPGFKTEVRKGIIVQVGKDVVINVTLKPAKIKETIVVTAETPVVETRKAQVAVNVNKEQLQELPTARDPWVILELSPGVIVDRENVGGNESGQQSGFQARGAPTQNNIWAMDGVVITDPAAIGASPTYYDFDAFEEMNITVGGADVEIQSGGVAINFVTRRGGNKTHLDGRFYLTDEKFQDDNLTDELIAEGVKGTDRIVNIKDYGFNAGGPIVRDKAWWWMAYGVQDIKKELGQVIDPMTGLHRRDDTLLQNYNFKLNLQLHPKNRFEALLFVGSKEKWGRSASQSFPYGFHQTGKYHFGNPMIKLQDEHIFGENLFLSVKWANFDSAFGLKPMNDEDQSELAIYDYLTGQWTNSYYAYQTFRPTNQFVATINYFLEGFLGADHEIKVGFDYKKADVKSYWSTGGNVELLRNYGATHLLYDKDGDGTPDADPDFHYIDVWRAGRWHTWSKDIAFYIQDVFTVGRLTFNLGLRYDYQKAGQGERTLETADPDHSVWQNYFTPGTAEAIQKILPPIEFTKDNIPHLIDPDYAWKTLSPRLAITYDITGDGKNVVKLFLARYGEVMGTGVGDWFEPFGGPFSGVEFYWKDVNGDGLISYKELYWTTLDQSAIYRVFDDAGNFIGNWGDYHYWAFDPANPTKVGDPRNTVDKSAGAILTDEIILAFEKELMRDFGVLVNLIYRRNHNFRWTLWYWPDTGRKLTQDDYIQYGTVPSDLDGISSEDAAGRPYYGLAPGIYDPFYRLIEKRPDYYQEYYGIDIIFNKRLSNRWMFNGSITLQNQKQHFGDKGYLDPTNLWAIDNNVYAPRMGGGSGKISMYVFSRWLVKLTGLYQLPYDINASFSFVAREGYIIPRGFTLYDPAAPNPFSRSHWIYMERFGETKLPTFWMLNFRLEKVVKVGETGKIYFSFDLFNATNNNMVIRRYDDNYGTYALGVGWIYRNPLQYQINEILNPRVFRLGVRFSF